MTGKAGCISRDARRAGAVAVAAENGHSTLVAGCRRGMASFACILLMLLFASVSSRAQQLQAGGGNTAPLEGPSAGSDMVLVSGTGLSGAGVTVTADASWITSPSMTMTNGAIALRFQFTANTDSPRQGHIVVQGPQGSPVTVTVTQAGAGWVPAQSVPIIKSISGPRAIAVDPQGNLFILEVSGEKIYKWTAANQTLTTLTTGHPADTFVDVAVDAAGDLFVLGNTPDGNLGTEVDMVPAQDLSLPNPLSYVTTVFQSEDNNFLFPAGLCVDPSGQKVNVTSYAASTKCLIDVLGRVYELDSTDDDENVGIFQTPPTNANYNKPPRGSLLFPNGGPDFVDACNTPLPAVSGSIYGLFQDGNGYIYFLDQSGLRLNKYDLFLPSSTCTVAPGLPNGPFPPTYQPFTTVANLAFPGYAGAADTTGNIYLSDMPFSRIDELPRAYLSPGGPFNEPVGGGTGQINILPATQSLSGVFAPVSSDTSWLTVTGAANGFVTFSCAPNTNGPSRTGTITVLGVPISITQAGSQVPAGMLMVAGNNQTAAVNGLPFPTNLLVKVVNSFGEPVPNVTVNFFTPTQNVAVITDQRGYAATTAMTAYAVGANTVTAQIPLMPIWQLFHATGVASGISIVSGSNQQRQLNTYFADMVVQVIGADTLPAAGVPVTFTAPASGATGTFPSNASTITVNTGADGTATAHAFQANGTYGAYTVTASISGLSGVNTSTVAFNLTNFGQVQELVGDQTAIVNNAFASPLGVKVSDANGNPLGGASVIFEIFSHSNTSGGAFFPDGSQTETLLTGSDGIIHSQSMTASAFPGSYNVDAVVTFPDGSIQVANWTLTNVSSAIVSGALQNGVTTRTLTQPLIVQASPNATAGTMVFTVVPGSSGSGGSFNGQSSVTVPLDSQGYGISPLLKLNGSFGTFTVTAYDGVQTVQGTVTAAPCTSYPSSVVMESSEGGLRSALANACAGTTIDLTPVGLGNTLTLNGGRLRIDDDMTITGPVPGLGDTPVAINGGGKSRIFFIGNGSVTISNLILENGLAQGGDSVFGGGGAGMGGAIFIEGGNVTLTNVAIAGNEAKGGGSGVASQCTTNCLYGGGGFAGTAGNGVSPGIGGTSGDLFGLNGLTEGANGDMGGGGAAAEIFVVGQPLPNPNGGNGGFGAGGGAGWYNAGATTSGNGGFGGGGGGGYNGGTGPGNSVVQLLAGTGGYGGGSGYEPAFNANVAPYPNFGGTGAGFGGGIFLYSGQLTLNSVDFYGNHAVAGTLTGLSGQPTVTGQAKGGAIFIYNGAQVINNSSTFGLSGSSPDYAADAGLPGKGNSLAPYTNGALCPGLDTADVCGLLGSGTAVSVTVPTGMTFTVNGVTYTGSQTLNLSPGQYTLTAPGPQATGVGSQTAFSSWSDGGAASHTITVGSSALSITGTFVTQYLLTTTAVAGGAAFPVTGFVNANSVVNLNAAANVGSAFLNWTGPVAAANSAATTVTMTGPQSVTANFTNTQRVTIIVQPNVSFSLNGVNYIGSQTVSLPAGQYTLSTTSPQVGGSGSQQLLFSSWSDGGAISHSITVGASSVSITGSFSTQYLLTASAGPGGAISNVNGFYDSGTVVNLTATPNSGYVFHNWVGPVASPSSASTIVNISQATTVSANFWPSPTACVAAPANITAWWKGDTSATDETTLNNGTLGGDASFATGLVGQAFSFDGTQSPYVTLPAGAFPAEPSNAPFSFETWFQTAGGNGGVILGEQSGTLYGTNLQGYTPAVYVGTDGDLHVEMFYNGTMNQAVSSVPVNDNAWHHVAVTYDGSSEIAYLDGTNIGQSLGFTQAPNGPSLSYQLGTGYTYTWPSGNGGWYTFNGLIDEPTMYSRALGAAEVLSIAQAGSYGKCDAVASVNSSTVTFASLAPGQSATQTAVLSNPGNAPLVISSIVPDTGDMNFSLLSGNAGDCTAGTPVQPSSSCNVRIQFAPQGTGAVSGTISISDNSVAGQGTQIVSLVGSAQLLTPAVTFSGPSFAVYGSTFTPVVSTNSGAAATVVASGSCQINAGVVTMTAGTSQCQLQANWAANGSFAAATASLSVNAIPLGVMATVSAANKVFDGTTVATVSSCTLSNSLPTDAGNVSCSASSAAFASSGVGNNIPVTVTGLALSGPASANYQLSSTTAATTANIAFGSADSACVAPPAGVTAWWKGDGDATDVTGAYGGVLGGDVSFAPGKVGQAFSFDGTQSPYATLPAGAFPDEPSNAPFSFETWFQTAGGNGGVILGEQSGTPYGTNLQGYTPAIYVGTDGKLYSQMFYSSNLGIAQVVSAIPVNDNAWHHVAVTYDGTNEVVYLDAGAIGTINQLVQGPNGPSLSYQLGTGYTYTWPSGNSGWYTFNGLIDETAIYSRALNPGEVASIVQAESYGKCNPEASISPATLTFGTVPSGQTAALTAVVSNPGNAPLTISSIGPDTGDINFSVVSGNANDCAVGAPVQPGNSCNVRVQFAPQSTGSLAGSVTVYENSLNNAGTQTIQLAGTSLGSQTITFPSIAAQTVGTSLTLVATASSGLAVNFTSATPSVCSVSGNMATFLTYGNCTVTATQAGTGNYAAASPVSRTFAVISPQTITFPGIGSQMVGTPLILTATATSGLPVSYTASPSSVCSVSGSKATFAITGTCTIKASQTGNANYLPAVPVMQSFTVGKQAQSITWATIPSQNVLQTVALTASASSGLPITYTSSPASVCTVSASTASLIAGGTCTIKASQAGNATYASQSVYQSFTVNKLAQSITFSAIATPQFVVAQAALSASSTSGLGVTITPYPATVCTVSGTTVAFIASGTCKLTATQPGTSVYAAASSVSQSIVVSKIAQTISFGSIPGQTAGGSLNLTATATSGLATTYTASPSSICTVSGSTASFVAGGTCTITARQAGNTDYSAAVPVSQSFTVNKLAQSITFSAIATPQFVGAQAALSASSTSGLSVTITPYPATVCTVSGTTVAFTASGTCKLTATQPGTSVYAAASSVSQSIVVSKIAQTISFGSMPSQTAEGSLNLTATATSGLATTYTASPSSICTVSGSTASFVAGGTCTITAKQAGNATYSAAAPVSQSVHVQKVSQTIAFPSIAPQNMNASVTLAATATSGLTVSYAATPSSVCKISGSTASMTGSGTCTITASQGGNGVYAAATSVPESFLVSKLAQSVSFGNISTQTVGTSLTLAATASSGLAVSYAATPLSVCKVSGTTATMVGSGTCTITASQAGNSTYAAATVVPVSFVVNKVAQTISSGTAATQREGTPLTWTAKASSGLTVTYPPPR